MRSGALPVMLPGEDARVLGSAARTGEVRFLRRLNQVSRENGKRRVVVQANVRGNDLGSFVAEAQEKVAAQVKLPPGSFIEWGGQFKNLQAASQTLSLVIPIIFAAIFGILFLALGGVRQAIAVYSAIPLALAGGVFSLLLTGLPFSVSAAVGFIVLSGVGVLNGLVVMTSINTADRRGQAGR
jgi:cobalt-zinc-cadmium resistance protein CzcA